MEVYEIAHFSPVRGIYHTHL